MKTGLTFYTSYEFIPNGFIFRCFCLERCEETISVNITPICKTDKKYTFNLN